MLKTKIRTVAEKALFELTIVSLGILLALAVNAGYKTHQQEEQAQALLKKVEYEINNNFTHLKDVNSAFSKSIERTQDYLSDLKNGKEIDVNYTVNILAVDFAVWKFTQHRKELDQLPVDILIAISEGYRALEKAEALTQELAFSKFRNIMDTFEDKEREALNELSIELKQVKFHLDIAQTKLKDSINMINQYSPA